VVESRAGASLGEVLDAGLSQYEHEGFPDEWRLHHQGGLTGYAGREIFATPGEPHRLSRHQVVAWNPSITRVKSEDTVLVTADGCEILTRTDDWPRKLVTVASGAIERPSMLEKG
jgi:Xaa-Pro aminopeptidase